MLVPAAIIGLLAPSALGHVVRERPFGCGAPEPTDQQIAAARTLGAKEKEMKASGFLNTQEVITVDTYFHVVSISEDPEEGYLTDEILALQLDVMNADYAPSGFQFDLKNTTRTINTSWATDTSELEMKTALRQGSYRDLNVYFLSSLSGLLGYCYFPVENITTDSLDFVLDGCSVLFTSVPEGSETNYNLGKTVTHEVGHWMNLYHTFQGGCTGAGDMIDDTPAQSGPTSGCPVGRDSCPTVEGLDPIHNYMDYSYDSCYEEFTADQGLRMRSSWESYRLAPSTSTPEAGK